MIIVLAALLNSCAGNGEQNGGTSTPDTSQEVIYIATLSEAESLLPFQVTLPSFLPAGTSGPPELSVLYREDRTPLQLEAVYWEKDTVSPGISRLRMRIREVSGRFSLPETLNFEVVKLGGIPVEFTGKASGEEHVEAVAAWSHEGTGYQVEFLWLSDEGTSDGEVTDQMRADALKVIESMIE